MSERLGEALLDLRTDDKGFDRGIDTAERKAQGLGRRLDDTARRAAAMGKALAVAAAAGVTAIGLLVKRQIDQADEMSKNAQRVGVTTEALSRLAWAGDLSDVSMGSLTGSMARLSNVMSQVASGQGKDVKAIFDGIGVSVTDTAGRLRDLDLVMGDLADVFASLDDGAEKTALAVRIFGRSGAELIPLLNNGRNGLAEMAAEADRLGITISSEMGRRAEAFNDAMTRVRAAFQGIIVQIADQLLPYLNEFGDMLNDPQFVANAQAMARDVVSALGSIASALRDMIGLFREAREWVDWLEQKLPYGIVGLMNKGGRYLWDKPPSEAQRGLSDENFDSRFEPGLPGKTDRLPRSGGERRSINLSDLLGSASTGGGRIDAETRALEAKRQAVIDLIAQLETERDVMRETDPVAREMIALRDTLAAATGKQKDQVRDLIAEQHREREAIKANAAAMREKRDLLDSFISTFMNGIEQGKNFWRSLGDAAVAALGRIADKLLNEFLDAIIQVGNVGGGGFLGGIGGVFEKIFAGFFAKGGLIPSGTFGIVGERGPEPVISTSRGAMVLPNSSLAAAAGGRRSAGGTEATVRLIMPEGWRSEIVGEARRGAAGDAVRIVEEFEAARQNSFENGAAR